MITFTITFVSLLVYNYSATIIIVNSVQHSKCWRHNYDCTVNVIGTALSLHVSTLFWCFPCMPNPITFHIASACVCWNLISSVKGLSL